MIISTYKWGNNEYSEHRDSQLERKKYMLIEGKLHTHNYTINPTFYVPQSTFLF